jgi:hypothetical protein
VLALQLGQGVIFADFHAARNLKFDVFRL